MRTKQANAGFLPLPRSTFRTVFWMEERIYSRAEAWIDLMQMAGYREQQTVMCGNVAITCGRGQLVASLRYLSVRWKWSGGRVSRFMDMLEDMRLISREACKGQTIVTIHPDNGAAIDTPIDTATVHHEHPSNPLPQQDTEHTHAKRETKTEQETEQERNKYKEQKNLRTKEEEMASYHQLLQWMKEHTPAVLRLPEGITERQYATLVQKLDMPRIRQLLMAMHNYPPLLKKYRSAYHTLLRWAEREQYNTQIPNHEEQQSTLSPASQQLKAAISRRKK